MKTFLFIFLAGYAVRCDDNYYVVRMPDVIQPKEFKVYWNVPTMQCKSKKIPFDDLYEKYGIIQNTDDTHRGDKISILYDPGYFPALVKNETTGEIRYRNGGVPQQGDLIEHLQIFKHEMEKSIPDKNFNGIGIIDFESWRPILRQNFGILTPYKDVSYDIERKRHWWWKKQWIQDEARRRFDASGRDFMQTTLALAKKLRPKALWGYYGYPQCFNRPYNSNPEKCASEIPGENDEIDWLWSESTALYPSVYSTEDMSASQLAAFIRGRVKESARVRDKGTPILPYWWYRYRDDGFFNEIDLEVSLSTFYKSDATGFIIWGSSKDVNTKEKCLKLRAYVTDTLGPAIAKYTKPGTRVHDIPDDISPTTYSPGETVTKLDPEYHWDPPENYSQNIEHIVDEELKKENASHYHVDKINESILIDFILHKIANFCSVNCGEQDSSEATVSFVPPNDTTTKDPFKDNPVKYATTTVSATTEDDNLYEYIDESKVILLNSNYPDDYESINTIANTEPTDLSTSGNIDTTTIYTEEFTTTTETVENSVTEFNSDYSSTGTFDRTTKGNYSNDEFRTFKIIYDDFDTISSDDMSGAFDYGSYDTSTISQRSNDEQTTELDIEEASIVNWNILVTTMRNTNDDTSDTTDNTSDTTDNTSVAVNTTAVPMLREQVVVSVV